LSALLVSRWIYRGSFAQYPCDDLNLVSEKTI
jgi:hypothetical protein